MKEKNVGPLRWFVDFANLDLENIKPGDKAKLLIEAEEYLWPKKELEEYRSSMPPGYPLTEKLQWMVEAPPRESPEFWTAVLRSQAAVKETFEKYVLPTVHPSPENAGAKGKPAVGSVLRGYDEMLWWVVKGYKVPYTMKQLPAAKSQDDYLPLKIFLLLDGFPQHAISRCPGCNRFFLNPTNREKRFCSEKCMRRIVTAEYRETKRVGSDPNEPRKTVLQRFLGTHTEAELREFQQNKADIFDALATRLMKDLPAKSRPAKKKWKRRYGRGEEKSS